MAITSYNTIRQGNVTTVTVVSSLTGTIFYHWYLDGVYAASTQSPRYSFALGVGEQARIDVLDTNDAAFDPIANAPDVYPARFSLWWVRSLETDVKEYRVEQSIDGGANWTTIGVAPHQEDAWSYGLLSPRLADLTVYNWRIVPVDKAGNDGTPFPAPLSGDSLGEWIVRNPDAPNFSASWSAGTQRVTFAAA